MTNILLGALVAVYLMVLFAFMPSREMSREDFELDSGLSIGIIAGGILGFFIGVLTMMGVK